MWNWDLVIWSRLKYLTSMDWHEIFSKLSSSQESKTHLSRHLLDGWLWHLVLTFTFLSVWNTITLMFFRLFIQSQQQLRSTCPNIWKIHDTNTGLRCTIVISNRCLHSRKFNHYIFKLCYARIDFKAQLFLNTAPQSCLHGSVWVLFILSHVSLRGDSLLYDMYACTPVHICKLWSLTQTGFMHGEKNLNLTKCIFLICRPNISSYLK